MDRWTGMDLSLPKVNELADAKFEITLRHLTHIYTQTVSDC